MQEPHRNGDTPVFDDLVHTLLFSPDNEPESEAASEPNEAGTADDSVPATKPNRGNLWFAIAAACGVLALSSGLYIFEEMRNDDQAAAELSSQLQPEPVSIPPITFVDPIPTDTEVAEVTETEVISEPAPEAVTLEAITAAEDAQVQIIDVYGAKGEIHSSASMGHAGLFVTGFPTPPPGIGIQMWTTNHEGVVSSAGMVTPSETGTWMPAAPGTTRIMLSEEPETGSEAPTGGILVDYGL